jgi:hypothetical protein
MLTESLSPHPLSHYLTLFNAKTTWEHLEISVVGSLCAYGYFDVWWKAAFIMMIIMIFKVDHLLVVINNSR